MNHTKIVSSIANQFNVFDFLVLYNILFILRETNSFYNKGILRLSNVYSVVFVYIRLNITMFY